MKKSRAKLLTALRGLQQERRRLVQRLTRDQELAIGSVVWVMRKCGNPRCSCRDGAGHPQTLFLFRDVGAGRRRCKLVRRADEVRLHQAGERYRRFRADLRRLRAIDQEETGIFMALAEQRAIHYE